MSYSLDEALSRIEALETKVSYQEATIAELSTALYEQDQRLARLEDFSREAAGKLKEAAEAGLPPLPADERPPHY